MYIGVQILKRLVSVGLDAKEKVRITNSPECKISNPSRLSKVKHLNRPNRVTDPTKNEDNICIIYTQEENRT